MLALIVCAGDGLYDPEGPLPPGPRVLLVIVEAVVVLLLLPQEVVLLVRVQVPADGRGQA